MGNGEWAIGQETMGNRERDAVVDAGREGRVGGVVARGGVVVAVQHGMDVADRSPDEGCRKFRSFTKGVIECDGVPSPVAFVHDPAGGAVVFAGPREFLECEQLVLFLPDDRFESMQALLSPAALDEGRDGALIDRHGGYHPGRAEGGWVRARVVTVRDGGAVWEGERVSRPNALAACEGELRRALNADKARLAAMVERRSGVRPVSPVAVGVDEDGCDVRAGVGVVRVAWPARTEDAAAARAMVASLLAGAV